MKISIRVADVKNARQILKVALQSPIKISLQICIGI